MYDSILVPADISETDSTRQVIPYMRAHSALNITRVHFSAVVSTLPYHLLLGLAYLVEVPKLRDFQYAALLRLDEIIRQFKVPTEKIRIHAVFGAPRDQTLNFAKTTDADLIIITSHRPDIATYLLGLSAAVAARHACCPVLVVQQESSHLAGI